MRRSSPVPEWVPPELPNEPGVYRFLDERGAPLYIGKSVNLRRRVRGYFYGGGPGGRLAEMLALAQALSYRRTGSDLEAQVLEARAILRRRPRFNRALKNRWRGWYLELDESVPFPRPRVVRAVRRPSAHYFGPFAGRGSPLEIVRLIEKIFGLRSCPGSIRPDPAGAACLRYDIGSCPAPCIGAVGVNSYRRRAREAVRALGDPAFVRRLRDRLVTERDRESAGFDRAAAQRRLEWLDELEGFRWALERPSERASYLVILPHHLPERRVLLPVALGKALPMRETSRRGERWRSALSDACYAVRVRELRMDTVLGPGEMVVSLIIRRWLEAGAAGGRVYDLGRMSDDDVLEVEVYSERSSQVPAGCAESR